MATSVALWVLAAVLVGAGIAGTLLPALPGPVLVFGGLVVAAWIDDFANVGGGTIGVLAAMTALTYVVDFAASALGARRVGASKRAVIGAAIGGVVGLFFGLPGLLLGPFVGAVIGELSAHRDLERAGRAGFGTWLGLVFGTAVKLMLLFGMLGVFAVAYGL